MRVLDIRHIDSTDFLRGIGWVLFAPVRAVAWLFKFGVWITYHIRLAAWSFMGLVLVFGVLFILYDFGWQIFHHRPASNIQQHEATPIHVGRRPAADSGSGVLSTAQALANRG